MASADLEVYAEVERQTSVVRRVERVVTDVRQTDVVCYVEVEQVVSHAASYAQTSVKALEGIVGERAEGLALVIVFILPPTPHARYPPNCGCTEKWSVML